MINYKQIRLLSVGDSFGEIAILSENKKRTATIVTVKPCVLATLHEKDFHIYLKHIKDKKNEAFIKWLRSTAFFGKWSRSMLLKLLSTMREIEVQRGTIMTFENERCSKFFIIQSGEFEITKKVLKPINKDEPEKLFLQKELKRIK
jgi:CRP-like cAMP-binding protein